MIEYLWVVPVTAIVVINLLVVTWVYLSRRLMKDLQGVDGQVLWSVNSSQYMKAKDNLSSAYIVLFLTVSLDIYFIFWG